MKFSKKDGPNGKNSKNMMFWGSKDHLSTDLQQKTKPFLKRNNILSKTLKSIKPKFKNQIFSLPAKKTKIFMTKKSRSSKNNCFKEDQDTQEADGLKMVNLKEAEQEIASMEVETKTIKTEVVKLIILTEDSTKTIETIVAVEETLQIAVISQTGTEAIIHKEGISIAETETSEETRIVKISVIVKTRIDRISEETITGTLITEERTDFSRKKTEKMSQELKNKKTFHTRFQRNQSQDQNLDLIRAEADLTKPMNRCKLHLIPQTFQ